MSTFIVEQYIIVTVLWMGKLVWLEDHGEQSYIVMWKHDVLFVMRDPENDMQS